MTLQFLDKQNAFRKNNLYFLKFLETAVRLLVLAAVFLPLKAFPDDGRFTLPPSHPLRGGLPPAETQFPYIP